MAEIRSLVAEHGHSETNWSLGPSTEPSDLYEHLRALGAEAPEDGIGELTAMVATEPPDAAPAGVEVREVATLEEYGFASEIGYEGFETPERHRELGRRIRAERWQQTQDTPTVVTYLAWIDGRPAASALAVFCPLGGLLIGGTTAPWARGRGAYRALVRARWDEAVRRGAPALVVQAAPASEPILRRIGFEEVCRVRRLQDPA